MRTGEVVETFEKEGEKFTVRYPKMRDWKGFLRHLNSLVEDEEVIGFQKKRTEEEGIEWMAEKLSAIEKEELILLAVEHKGKVKGRADVSKGIGAKRHLVRRTITLDKEIRRKGVGTKLVNILNREIKKNFKDAEIISASTLEDNKSARALMKEKTDLKFAGRIKNVYKTLYGDINDEISYGKKID